MPKHSNGKAPITGKQIGMKRARMSSGRWHQCMLACKRMFILVLGKSALFKLEKVFNTVDHVYEKAPASMSTLLAKMEFSYSQIYYNRTFSEITTKAIAERVFLNVAYSEMKSNFFEGEENECMSIDYATGVVAKQQIFEAVCFTKFGEIPDDYADISDQLTHDLSRMDKYFEPSFIFDVDEDLVFKSGTALPKDGTCTYLSEEHVLYETSLNQSTYHDELPRKFLKPNVPRHPIPDIPNQSSPKPPKQSSPKPANEPNHIESMPLLEKPDLKQLTFKEALSLAEYHQKRSVTIPVTSASDSIAPIPLIDLCASQDSCFNLKQSDMQMEVDISVKELGHDLEKEKCLPTDDSAPMVKFDALPELDDETATKLSKALKGIAEMSMLLAFELPEDTQSISGLVSTLKKNNKLLITTKNIYKGVLDGVPVSAVFIRNPYKHVYRLSANLVEIQTKIHMLEHYAEMLQQIVNKSSMPFSVLDRIFSSFSSSGLMTAFDLDLSSAAAYVMDTTIEIRHWGEMYVATRNGAPTPPLTVFSSNGWIEKFLEAVEKSNEGYKKIRSVAKEHTLTPEVQVDFTLKRIDEIVKVIMST